MKKLIWLLFSFCALLTTSVAMGASLSGMTNDSAEKIELKGDLPIDKQRSLIKPIQAFIVGQSVEVDFNAGLGIIVISIYDEEGNAVYRQSVSTYSGIHTIIDISSFEDGEYVIEFTNSQGKYLSGNFEIE